MNLFSIYKLFFQILNCFFPLYFSIFLLRTFLSFFVYVFFYVGAGATTLMSNSDGSNPHFFRRKIEKTRSVKEELDGRVFNSRQSRHLSHLK